MRLWLCQEKAKNEGTWSQGAEGKTGLVLVGAGAKNYLS